jgi:APA family basic amino acid/polyamine antiporter
VLRVRQPDLPRPFRLPLGPVIPLAATLVSVALLAAAKPRAAEWISSGVLLMVGILAWGATRLFARKTA